MEAGPESSIHDTHPPCGLVLHPKMKPTAVTYVGV